jgi:tripartite-type tricarboxylate transporter receptor subunit TctC
MGALAASPASAEPLAWPDRALRLWVPSSPGGGADVMARMLASRLSARSAVPVVVENRMAAGGAAAVIQLAREPADGSTLMVTFETFVLNPIVFREHSYDPLHDYSLITLLSRYELFLLAPASRRIVSLSALIDRARQMPGGVNFASPGPGGPARFAFEALKLAAGMAGTPVHYRGIAPALQGLLGGELDAGFAQVNSVVSAALRSGRLVALASGGVRRSPAFPTVPALNETWPGLEARAWAGLIGPPGIAPLLVSRIAEVVRDVMDTPPVRDQLHDQGGELVLGTPAAFAAVIAADSRQWRQVVRDAGITIDP